jgi:hypothetical protein
MITRTSCRSPIPVRPSSSGTALIVAPQQNRTGKMLLSGPPLATLERFPIQWNRKVALCSCIIAFSRREPVSVSLENALALSVLARGTSLRKKRLGRARPAGVDCCPRRRARSVHPAFTRACHAPASHAPASPSVETCASGTSSAKRSERDRSMASSEASVAPMSPFPMSPFPMSPFPRPGHNRPRSAGPTGPLACGSLACGSLACGEPVLDPSLAKLLLGCRQLFGCRR